jgi:alpha-L-fucosidase
MKIKCLTIIGLAFILLFISQQAQSQLPKETEAQKTQRLKWWTDSRFGMFIHWVG